MSQNLLYFFSALAQSIAAIIAFSIAAIIFYKKRVEEQLEHNVNVYKFYANSLVFGVSDALNKIDEAETKKTETINMSNMEKEVCIWEKYIEVYKNYIKNNPWYPELYKEYVQINYELQKFRLGIGLMAIKNIQFYILHYKEARKWFWGSFGILAIIISLLPLFIKFCDVINVIFVCKSLIFAIGTVVAIVFLLVNIFAEPKQENYGGLLAEVENCKVEQSGYSKPLQEELKEIIKTELKNWQ